MTKLSDTTDIIKKLHVYWDDNSGLELVNEVVSGYKKNNPDYEINLMDKVVIKNFLKASYSTLYKYFDLFNTYATRSDIARLVYLYLYGGFYCDMHVSVGNIDLVTVEESQKLNANSKSFLGNGGIGFMYSQKEDDLLLKCLNICEYEIKKIIDSNLIGPDQYCREMHLATGNGLYDYHKIDGSGCKYKDPESVSQYFGNLIEGDIFRPYQSEIFTKNNTRANNKHWSTLCKEISFI